MTAGNDNIPGMKEMLGPMARQDTGTHPDLFPDAAERGDGNGDGDGGADRPRDMAGTVFDARVHGTKPDGSPSLTSKGLFRRKRGARATTGSLDLSGAETAPPASGPEAAGITCAGLYVMIGSIILGEDFSPENTSEFEQLSDAFTDYCRSKGIDDFPPGVALTLACAMYAAKRLPKPRVQSRIAGMIGWVQGRWSRARAYFGADGMRENDTSKKANWWRSRRESPGANPGPQPA